MLPNYRGALLATEFWFIWKNLQDLTLKSCNADLMSNISQVLRKLPGKHEQTLVIIIITMTTTAILQLAF